MASATNESRILPTAFALSLASVVIIVFGGILPWLFLANFQASAMGGMMGVMMTGSWTLVHWRMALSTTPCRRCDGSLWGTNDERTTSGYSQLGNNCVDIFGIRISRNGTIDTGRGNRCCGWGCCII